MKKIFLILLILLLFISASFSETLGKSINQAVDLLSRSFRTSYPDLATKAGAAVLDLENDSDDAKKNKIGETIGVFLLEAVPDSLVFTLVDRENLDQIISEMKLSLSGLTDESSAVEIGNLTNIRALIWGNVVDVKDKFRITLKLTDNETGKIIETASFEIEKKLLIEISTELQYSYVAKNGIGLTIDPNFLFITKPALFNKSSPNLQDLSANYRVSRWLMFSAGIITSIFQTGEHYRYDNPDGYFFSEFQPGIPAASQNDFWSTLLGGHNANGKPGQVTADIAITLIHLDAQFTVNLHPKFNIGLSAGAVFPLTNPTMDLHYGANIDTGLFYRQQLADPAEPDGTVQNAQYYDQPFIDTKPIHYLFDQDLPGGKFEVRPEFFITPRLAVHAKIGYLLMPKMYVRQIHATYGDWYFYQEGKDTNTWVPDPAWVPGTEETADSAEQQASYVYYGFNPLLKPEDGRWILDLSSFYWQIGISVFF